MPDNESTARLSLNIDDLKRGLREAKQEIQRANATFKAETAGMDDWTKNADGLSAKLRNLDEVLGKQRQILSNYNDQLRAHKTAQSQAAEEADRLRREMQALADKGVEPTADEYKKLDRQYQAALKSEQAEATQIKKLETNIISQTGEIKKTETETKKWQRAQEDLARESKSLVSQVDAQERELKDLKRQYIDVAASEGKNSAAAKELGDRISDLSADLGKNKKALREAESSAEELDRSYDDLGKSAAGAGAGVDEAGGSLERVKDIIVGGLAVKALSAAWNALQNAVRSAVSAISDAVVAAGEYADEILTLSSTTGLAAESLQEFAYMEDLVDVSSGTVAKSVNRLKKQMAAAQKGSKTAVAAFDKLGISYTNLDGSLRNSEDVFYEIVDALGAIENETERDAVGMDLFGKSATDLNPLIEAGAEALESFRKEAHDAGYVLSGPTLKALGQQQDAMDRLEKKADAVKTAFAARLAPGVTAYAEQMASALDNPRVERGLDLVASGLNSVIESASSLAAKALPELFKVFNFGDVQLRLFSDRQLELAAAADRVAQEHGEMTGAFEDGAKAVLAETERTQKLWDELQTLADENGKVKKKDKERAKFILSELNDALGTEYTMNGRIIQNYKDMRAELDELIKKREAEALIAAGADAFADAEAKREEALRTAAQLYPEVEQKQRALEKASRDYAKAVSYANTQNENGIWSDDRALRYINEYLGRMNDAQAAYDEIAVKYGTARDAARAYYADTERWQRAQTAAANGNYQEVVRILTSEFAVSLAYYRDKKQLNEQEKKDLRDKISDAELNIAEYKRNLKAGLQGFSEAGLQEMEDYVADAKRILNGKDVGKGFIDGITEGLKDKAARAALAGAAAGAAYAVQNATRNALGIHSPSKVGEWMGEMWDEGIVLGLKSGLRTLKTTARAVASALPAAVPSPAARLQQAPGTTSGGTVNNFTQNIYAPKTPSRLDLYRDSKNLLEMEALK